MKSIPNFEGYFIDRLGRVFSNRNPRNHKNKRGIHQLKVWVSRGYLRVGLYKDGKNNFRMIHSLLLETFVGTRKIGQIARHLNDRKSDNRLKNLAWGSPKENCDDALRNGLRLRGEKSPTSKLRLKDVRKIRSLLSKGVHQRQLAKRFGVAKSTITAINTGKIWRDTR